MPAWWARQLLAIVGHHVGLVGMTGLEMSTGHRAGLVGMTCPRHRMISAVGVM